MVLRAPVGFQELLGRAWLGGFRVACHCSLGLLAVVGSALLVSSFWQWRKPAKIKQHGGVFRSSRIQVGQWS
eukprot:3543744-Lingulodinium_polyedra.AAC.1